MNPKSSGLMTYSQSGRFESSHERSWTVLGKIFLICGHEKDVGIVPLPKAIDECPLPKIIFKS
jgi:hypothetical protein